MGGGSGGVSGGEGVTETVSSQGAVWCGGAGSGRVRGDVLSGCRRGMVVRGRDANGSLTGSGGFGGGQKVTLPEEQPGTIMVFKVYDRIGYGLVMEATSDIHVLDTVRNPS